jgi:hypothetical protein
MGPPPAKKKSNTMLIVVIVIIVVIAVVVAGTLLVINSLNNTVNNVTDVTMTVTSSRTPASSEYSMAPATGMKYFQVTVSMTNSGDMLTSVSPLWFQLQASGTKYGYTPYVTSDSSSGSLLPGASDSFTVSFAIPSSATPQKIFFTPIFGHEVSANV